MSKVIDECIYQLAMSLMWQYPPAGPPPLLLAPCSSTWHKFLHSSVKAFTDRDF